jgi:hypothetical protein
VPVHLARAKCSRVLENRGRSPTVLAGFRRGLLVGEAATANLAVIGCHSVDAMDVGGQKRSWADVSGRPPPVLKIADLTSTGVHRGPLQFDRVPSDSRIACLSPPASAGLAVFLAVSDCIERDSFFPSLISGPFQHGLGSGSQLLDRLEPGRRRSFSAQRRPLRPPGS